MKRMEGMMLSCERSPNIVGHLAYQDWRYEINHATLGIVDVNTYNFWKIMG